MNIRDAATAGLIGALLALASRAGAAGPDPVGQALALTGHPKLGAPACASCHGFHGEGVAAQNAPRLAHLNADYLAAQLDAFASGARRSSVMGPIAARLSPEQRASAADFFAGLDAPAATPAPAASAPARGVVLARQGDWGVKVPACDACHGPAGVGVGAVTPPLSGQTAAYLETQLLHFRSGERRGEALGLMTGVASRLSPDDLRAAAAYYASLPLPLSLTGAKP